MPLGATQCFLAGNAWPEDIVLIALAIADLALFLPLLRQG